MDFKMKCDPKNYRHKSSDWYKHKGMSWHGTVPTFKSACANTEVEGQTGNVYEKLFTKNLYFDHICKNDTNQPPLLLCR